jgi:hypothetical protein
MNAAAIGMNPQPLDARLSWSALLGQSYRLYRERFWTMFTMALVPASLAYFSLYFCRFILRQLSGALNIHYFRPTPGAYAILVLSGWLEGACYWALSGFFFGAVASNILVDEGDATLPLSDAYTKARRRIGVVVTASLIIWTLFWLGRMVLNFSLIRILGPTPLSSHAYVMNVTFAAVPLLLAGLLSRLGLTIPELMNNSHASLRQALSASVKKTENWELFFVVFLIKSALLGFGLYWLGTQGLDWLWRQGALNATTFPWADRIVSISLAAALESPLFIAFAVLYRETRFTREDALPAVVK